MIAKTIAASALSVPPPFSASTQPTTLLIQH